LSTLQAENGGAEHKTADLLVHLLLHSDRLRLKAINDCPNDTTSFGYLAHVLVDEVAYLLLGLPACPLIANRIEDNAARGAKVKHWHAPITDVTLALQSLGPHGGSPGRDRLIYGEPSDQRSVEGSTECRREGILDCELHGHHGRDSGLQQRGCHPAPHILAIAPPCFAGT
jgi:hypothetical protein